MNGFVEDLENIVNELYEVQTKIDSGAIGGNKGGSDETPDALSKQLHDLEAHLNTSIITEKSVRKAQDKYLAEEIDKFQQQMTLISQKLSVHSQDNDKVFKEEKSEREVHIGENVENIQKLQTNTAELRAEVTALKLEQDKEGHKTKVTSEQVDINSEAIVKLESLVMALEGKNKENVQRDTTFATMSQVDGKVKAVLEKLKNENQIMWKETVNIAEKTFNEKGISQSMDLMPISLQGVTQLKTTINILDEKYGENLNQPKPQLNVKPE